MEPKKEISPGNMCRTCMVESENMRSLFNNLCGERTLGEVLTFVTNLDIKEQDNLPKQICNDCETVLAQSDAFKRRCIDVEARFFNLLKYPKLGENGPETIEKPVVKFETLENSTQPYQCSICSMRFLECNDLKTHVIHNHPNTDKTKHNSLEGSLKSDVQNQLDAKTNVKEELDNHEFTEDVFSSHYEDYMIDDASLDNHHQGLLEIKQKNKEYVCSLCGLVFENKSEHKEHLQVIHSSPNKKLSLIKKEPKSKKRKPTIEKTTHMKIDVKASLSEYYCKSCHVHFKNLKSLKNHNWKKHNNPLQKSKKSEYEDKIKKSEDGSKEKYECSLCMRKFVKKMTLIAHLKRHDNPTSYNCTLCKREFVHKAHLDNHILKIHSTHRDGYKCDSCPQYFPNQDSLNLHIEIHHSVKKMHECSFCSKSFNMLSTLKDHLRVHTGEKPFLCPLCGKGFSQNTNLTEHLRRHQGIKPFKCSMCDRRFVSKGELAAHSRKHSGAHPFICVDCGNGFTTSSSLVKHRRTHTGEKPYACDLCHLKFAASGTLKNHRRTHTGEKPYKCGLCDKAFVQKNDLTAHTRCHTGERPYVCSTCGQAFRQGSALKTHLKMHSIKGTEPLLHPVRKDLLQGLVLPSVGHPDSV